MAQNPRNKAPQTNTVTPAANSNGPKDPSEWSTLGLGSLAYKDGSGNLAKEGSISFTINSRNAQVIKDMADFILNNSDEQLTVSAGTYFNEDALSAKQKKFFSHRIYVSKDTLEKIGKTPADYVNFDK